MSKLENNGFIKFTEFDLELIKESLFLNIQNSDLDDLKKTARCISLVSKIGSLKKQNQKIKGDYKGV